MAARHGAAAYGSLDDFLGHRPMDMVAIGSPSGLHAEHGIAAAQHGLHVLVEKPIEVNTAKADALIAAAEQADVTLGVIFQDRLKPDVVRLRGMVEEGRLGSPILATAQVKWYRPPSYYKESRWRGTAALDGGGALINQGVHTVDLLLWLFGPIHRVFGKAATRLHAVDVEDTVVAVLEFANGAIGTLEAATSAFPGYPRRIELTGSNGTLILAGDDLAAIDLHDRRPDEQPVRAARAETSGGAATISAASPVVADATAHVRVFDDFIRAVTRHARPSCDGTDGRRSVDVIEAIYRSSRTGMPVDVTGRL
jgi:UDP-N-acetyl-2-amino-2-deoxyglucuronate dehydrogenase